MTAPVRQRVSIGDYQIDAFVSESHKFDSDVTEYPVESGGSITDNVRPKPIEVTIEGIVSDTPLGPIADVRQLGADASFTPSEECVAVLEGIRLEREPVTITTSIRTFLNMVMTSLEVPRDATTGAALRFSATFTEVIFVTNNRTTVRVATPSSGKQVALGQKAARAAHSNISSKVLIWKKGNPPGAPLVAGYAREEIRFASDTPDPRNPYVYTHNRYVHASTLQPLTDAETVAATADFHRDNATAAPLVGTYGPHNFTRLPD